MNRITIRDGIWFVALTTSYFLILDRCLGTPATESSANFTFKLILPGLASVSILGFSYALKNRAEFLARRFHLINLTSLTMATLAPAVRAEYLMKLLLPIGLAFAVVTAYGLLIAKSVEPED